MEQTRLRRRRQWRRTARAQIERPVVRSLLLLEPERHRRWQRRQQQEETRRRRGGRGGGGGGRRLDAAEDVGRHDQTETGASDPQDEEEPARQPAVAADRDQPRQQRRLGRLKLKRRQRNLQISPSTKTYRHEAGRPDCRPEASVSASLFFFHIVSLQCMDGLLMGPPRHRPRGPKVQGAPV